MGIEVHCIDEDIKTYADEVKQSILDTYGDEFAHIPSYLVDLLCENYAFASLSKEKVAE
jgi:hypothetical protein